MQVALQLSVRIESHLLGAQDGARELLEALGLATSPVLVDRRPEAAAAAEEAGQDGG